jgi:hypothetical protein
MHDSLDVYLDDARKLVDWSIGRLVDWSIGRLVG